MTALRFFPYFVAVGEAGACLVYLYYGEYKLFVVWLGYAIAACALATVK